MLPFPDSPTAPLLLADWLELQALLSPDRNSRRGALESALRPLSAFGTDNDEAVEKKILEVFYEIELRSKAAGKAYPFSLDYRRFGVIEMKSEWEDYSAYVFCLCLSYFGWDINSAKAMNPPKLFEQLSCLAAKRYLQGEAVGFGAPRTQLPSSFASAIDKLCVLIGEGEGYKSQNPTLNRQDDRLDIVAWKDFTDRLPSKIIMFGQCATGKNWQDKLAEMQPKSFWNLWMRRSTSSPLIRSFFVPHRIEHAVWRYVTEYGGIFFDRCRTAFWAHDLEAELSQQTAWAKASLARYV